MENSFVSFGPWKKAMALELKIHRVSASFPKEELYGVTAQLRRAILSVSSNIAEGFGRYTYPDKKHKYVQARGEIVEVMSILFYCRGVGYITGEEECEDLLRDGQDVHRMLNALISTMDVLSHSPCPPP